MGPALALSYRPTLITLFSFQLIFQFESNVSEPLKPYSMLLPPPPPIE